MDESKVQIFGATQRAKFRKRFWNKPPTSDVFVVQNATALGVQESIPTLEQSLTEIQHNLADLQNDLRPKTSQYVFAYFDCS